MPMVIIGVLLLVAKAAEFGPFAEWSWWIVAAPFAAAVVWWNFADSSGLTKRRAMEKIERRKAERREKAMAALGIDPLRQRQQGPQVPDRAARPVVSADPTQRPITAPSEPPRRDPTL